MKECCAKTLDKLWEILSQYGGQDIMHCDIFKEIQDLKEKGVERK